MRVNDLWRNNLDVLAQGPVFSRVEGESPCKTFENEVPISDNKPASESWYDALTHKNVRRIISVAHRKVRKTTEDVLSTTDTKWMPPGLRPKNVHTPIYEVIEQAAVKAFLNRGIDELFTDKTNKLSES